MRVGYTYESQPPVLLGIGPVPGVFRLADRVPIHRVSVVQQALMRLARQLVPVLCLFLRETSRFARRSPLFG